MVLLAPSVFQTPSCSDRPAGSRLKPAHTSSGGVTPNDPFLPRGIVVKSGDHHIPVTDDCTCSGQVKHKEPQDSTRPNRFVRKLEQDTVLGTWWTEDRQTVSYKGLWLLQHLFFKLHRERLKSSCGSSLVRKLSVTLGGVSLRVMISFDMQHVITPWGKMQCGRGGGFDGLISHTNTQRFGRKAERWHPVPALHQLSRARAGWGVVTGC